MNNETKQFLVHLLEKRNLDVPKKREVWMSYIYYHNAAEILDELFTALDMHEEDEEEE